MTNYVAGKTILITGAGGSIGSAMAHAVAKLDPKRLILLDQSEENLTNLSVSLREAQCTSGFVQAVGDICDAKYVSEIFERYQPGLVYHAAALKHVPLMEGNPLAAIRTNAIGTNTIAGIAHAHSVESFTLISTDKAVNPGSIMGASKRIAELAILRRASPQSVARAIRLGNVMWSQGSVLPLFRGQILAGGPVTVTHPDVSRYFLTMEDAVSSILLLSQTPTGSGLFVPHLGKPQKILQIATRMIEENAPSHGRQIPIRFTGLRPGDKMTEDLTSNREVLERIPGTDLFRIVGSQVNEEEFDSHMMQLNESVASCDLCGTLDTVLAMVPEYVPSDSLRALLERPAA